MKDLKDFKNIKNFVPKDLSGEKVEIPELNKLIGNAVYFNAIHPSVCESGRAIYAELDFEVTDQIIESVSQIKQLAPWLIEQFTMFLRE
jgi:hypothetical protein